MLGLEVETVQPLYQGLEQMVTARIVGVRSHPNADRLSLCDVDDGKEVIQVVCGAPNVKEGMVAVLARPGVRMPDGMKIRKAKVRGEYSLGMLCSARELGLGDDHSGIMELESGLDAGLSLDKALGLADTMIEVDLTPNRPDCASVLGIAREVAGFTRQRLTLPVSDAPALGREGEGYTVTIQDPDLCPRYCARRLSGVVIKPSPWWLQRQLLAVGQRPINNIVDITNFVMLEYGQPLHAFDFTSLREGKIVVRRPEPAETRFTTLDGVERELNADTLMICDGQGPVAVAGVMGGLDSEVTGKTSEVLLEAACFDPVSIRRTARRLNLPSEASYRFERGVDPETTLLAMERAVRLMVELAEARVEEGGVDLYPGCRQRPVIELRPGRVCDLLGVELDGDRIAGLLSSIDLVVEKKADNGSLRVTIPGFRPDLEREVDLVEEVARLYGYNEVPTTMPVIGMDYPVSDPMRELRKEAAAICLNNGFYEAINYSFTDEQHLDRLGIGADDRRRRLTRLLNPLTEDQAVMRTLLLPGLLDNVRHNISYQEPDLRLFEIGKVFFQHREGEQPEERQQLCAVMSGHRYPGASPYHFSGQESDLLDIKGLAEALIAGLRLSGEHGLHLAQPDGDAEPYAAAGSQISILHKERVVGRLGEVAAQVCRAWSIKQPVYFLELDLEDVVGLNRQVPSFRPIPRYPMVRRDIALLVPEKVPAGALLDEVRRHRADFVEAVELFDVYSGKPIDEGMKSVALSVIYRSGEKTLDDETVDRVHEKIVQSLMKTFGGRYREGA